MKIALLFDGISALGKPPDLSILETVEAVESVLAEDGHTVGRVAVTPDTRWIERVRRGRFDLAFNLCESVDGSGQLESPVIGALELMAMPYSGSSSWTTAICLRKHAVNAMLDSMNLPVPAWAVVRVGDPMPTKVGFPAICKPAAEDASLGVEQKSVVRNDEELASRVAAMHERWPEILVQRFVDGREVNVGIVGDTVLPIAEIDFGNMPNGLWRIVSYRSKWDEGCDEDRGATPVCPAPLDDATRTALETMARSAWRAVGGRGYGRVDCRIDRKGRPWILEVNANPDISPGAGLARMGRVAGLAYGDMIRRVCEHALDSPRLLDSDRWALSQRLSGIDMPDPVDADSAPPSVDPVEEVPLRVSPRRITARRSRGRREA